ncbi:molybdenum cofactor guanylyltransferase [Deinococcus sp. KSM4-11]|uniref:molybdenum cofactor guanylyltransferase n=1 Tax=Deinococcus sp. KSM4-11 TaxID=2568654 RepID=UPI00268C0779
MGDLVLTAAITAGGQSSRYGSDKALAVVDGQTLLEHVAASLERCGGRLLIAQPGRYALNGWRQVPDTRPGQGPLAGLEAALRAAPPGWVAFAGVDTPHLTPAYWTALAGARTPNALAILALDGEHRPQPLAALYHTALSPHITALLDAGERRLRLAAPEGQTVFVAGLDARFFRNVNRREDLTD